jgi:hypothetical protein
MVSFGD